ncbi:hypothetical protein K1719_013107 [Acacia pycnantha]|nr:hypothetical protein K1719_013107 [Acacia pycnantha]
MMGVKAINHSFTPMKDNTLYLARFSFTRSSISYLCKSNDSDPQSPPPPPEGDSRSQELLARIAQLQTQKVRLTDYLDERSDYLTKFGEEAIAELDKVGEDALKGLDEASERITANIEGQMVEFEEFAELNRREIEENENKVVDFEVQMEDDRNEGLFFKNLRQKAPVDKEKAKEEAKKITEVTKEKAGSRTRKNIYLFFIGLITFGIGDSVSSSSPTDWRKVAALAAILVALVSQFIYEQNMSSEINTTSQEKNNNKDVDNEEETK